MIQWGTNEYLAPETIINCDLYTPAVDIWGAGLTFAEMIIRERLCFKWSVGSSNITFIVSRLVSFYKLVRKD